MCVWVSGCGGVAGSCLLGDGGVFCEVERAGLQVGGLGEFVERLGGVGEPDRVAGQGGEFGEQAFVAVAGLAVGGVFAGGFALGAG